MVHGAEAANAGRLTQCVENEIELGRAYKGLAAIKERSGNMVEAQKLRSKAIDIFTRLRGAATSE
jgi:hypothetical protein